MRYYKDAFILGVSLEMIRCNSYEEIMNDRKCTRIGTETYIFGDDIHYQHGDDLEGVFLVNPEQLNNVVGIEVV